MDAADVNVAAKGDVGRKTTEYARRRVAHSARFAGGPILFARVRLIVEPDPARGRPALAKAELDVNGVMVRGHALGRDLHEAIDLMADRLRDELEHLTERRKELRTRGSQPRDAHEWRRGYLPTARPAYFERPAGERRIVRRKAYSLHPLTVGEAVDEMQRMAYDFHLFVCHDTGVPCVIARRPDGTFDIASVAGLPPTEDWLVPSAAPAPTLTELDAQRRLDATGDPFLLFTDAATGVAAVLYHRYDGHYGLITAVAAGASIATPRGTAR